MADISMEIEKKYTINSLPDGYQSAPMYVIEQGYLCKNPVIRIRKKNDSYILTYKSRWGEAAKLDKSLVSSNEVEVELNEEGYYHLKTKIDGYMVEKVRYNIKLDETHTAELDVFKGLLEGIIFVEVEFESEEDALNFTPPEWFGEDVSTDKRYRNSFLSNISDRETVIELFGI